MSKYLTHTHKNHFSLKKKYIQRKTGQTYQKNTITYVYLRGPLHAESSFDVYSPCKWATWKEN